MEFDKSRVYTAVNADELKVGSKCIFADTVKALRKKVQADDYAQYVQPFIRLHDNGYDVQFLADCYTYAYAYLIEPPAEPKYKPFESVDKAMEAIRKHGGWIKSKTTQGYFLIGALKSKKIYYYWPRILGAFFFSVGTLCFCRRWQSLRGIGGGVND